MTKKKVTEQKHYCRYCGRELIFAATEYQEGYSINTGKPVITIRYEWFCPKYHNLFSGDSHDHWWSDGNPDFSKANISGKCWMQ